jgi:Ca2+-binding EF-hand superfamily protein
VVLVGLLVGLIQVSVAQEEMRHRGKSAATGEDARNLMALIDVNGNKLIDMTEYTAWRNRVAGRHFARLDANGDKAISKAEYHATSQAHFRGLFYWLDTENRGFVSDGLITTNEYAPAGEPRRLKTFKQMDADGDGKVTFNEASTYWLAHELAKASATFDKRDQDKNGSLSFQEFAPTPQEIKEDFDARDTNHDGSIDVNEFVAFAEDIARERAQNRFGDIDQ